MCRMSGGRGKRVIRKYCTRAGKGGEEKPYPAGYDGNSCLHSRQTYILPEEKREFRVRR